MSRPNRAAGLFAAILLALALVSGNVLAQEKVPFTSERFEALQQEDALILLDVFADWCPTCALQQKVLADYREAHPDVPLHILTIDFDEQKAYVQSSSAPRASPPSSSTGGRSASGSASRRRAQT